MFRVLKISDPELLTLKAHLLVESALGHLLCVRLQLERSELPRLGFPQKAKLALGGLRRHPGMHPYPWGPAPLHSTLTLNAIRNAYAHEVTPGDQTKRMREIAALPSKIKGARELFGEAPDPLTAYRNGLAVLVGVIDSVRMVLASASAAQTEAPPDE